MVAVTPRRLKQTIWKSKLARNAGASYGYDLTVDETKVEEVAETGMTTGTGITSFGGMAQDLMNLPGGGLYPFGTGLYSMGSGMVPAFGMGIFSKIKGVAKSGLNSVLRGTTVKQLKNAVMDAGKRKVRQILPAVMDKVKTEINKNAPNLVTRLTSPALNKLPESVRGNISGLLEAGVNKGLAGVNKGLQIAQNEALKRIDGSGMPTPSTESTAYNDRQLAYMKKFGMDSQRGADAGEAPKRLILDRSSRSLAESILTDRMYNKIKRDELVGAVEHSGGGLMYHSLDYQPMETVNPPMKTVKAVRKTAKPKGRPRGSTTKGKGIVYL